jgi:hypothetical protein
MLRNNGQHNFRSPLANQGPQPSLVLDFAGTGTLDSRITFTRSTTGTYYNSSGVLSTAAINAARFDYNPSTLAPLGLLIEQSSTNLLLYSEDFSNAVWAKNSTTITANTTVAPDGNTTADTLVAAGTSSNRINEAGSSFVSGTTYSYTIFVKTGTKQYIQLGLPASLMGGSAKRANFDVTNGTLGTVDAAITASITASSNGFYRCAITFTALATIVDSIYITMLDSSTAAFIANSTAGNIILWGAQFEALEFATSYIPTTTAQVTRASDLVAIPKSSWFNLAQGTFYAQVIAGKASTIGGYGATNCFVVSTNNAATERLGIYFDSGTSCIINTYNGVNNNTATSTIVTAGISHKVASFYEASGLGITIDAGTVVSTSGTLPVYSTFTNLNIGQNYPTGGNFLNGWMAKLSYYPTRLTNAQIQVLTT